jgi:type VI protein secretion system component Hcp
VYETLTLSNVRVRSFKQSADRSNGVSETVAFSFTRMRFRFTRETAQGGQSGPVESCWDLPSKTAC